MNRAASLAAVAFSRASDGPSLDTKLYICVCADHQWLLMVFVVQALQSSSIGSIGSRKFTQLRNRLMPSCIIVALAPVDIEPAMLHCGTDLRKAPATRMR